MITAEKLAIYRSFGGNVDSGTTVSQRSDTISGGSEGSRNPL